MGKRVQLSLHFNTPDELQVYESLVKPLKNNKQLRLTLVELLKLYAKFPTEVLTLINNPRSFIVKDQEMEEFTDKIQEVETQLNLFSFFLEQAADTVESLSPENIEDTLENYKSFRESAEKEGLVSPSQGVQEKISIDQVEINDKVIKEMEGKINKLEQKVEEQTEAINNKLDVLIDKLSQTEAPKEAHKQESIQDQLMMQLLINLTQTNQQVLQQGIVQPIQPSQSIQTEAPEVKQKYTIPSGVLESIEKEVVETEVPNTEASSKITQVAEVQSEVLETSSEAQSEVPETSSEVAEPQETEAEAPEEDATSLLFDAISDSMI